MQTMRQHSAQQSTERSAWDAKDWRKQMSAHEVTYYQVQCDCCGKICDEYGDFSALSYPEYARDERPDRWAGIGAEDFCEDCWKWSDEEVDKEVRAHETHPKEKPND